jgi:hypothetical protein
VFDIEGNSSEVTAVIPLITRYQQSHQDGNDEGVLTDRAEVEPAIPDL